MTNYAHCVYRFYLFVVVVRVWCGRFRNGARIRTTKRHDHKTQFQRLENRTFNRRFGNKKQTILPRIRSTSTYNIMPRTDVGHRLQSIERVRDLKRSFYLRAPGTFVVHVMPVHTTHTIVFQRVDDGFRVYSYLV